MILPGVGFDCANARDHIIDKLHSLIVSHSLRLFKAFLHARGAKLKYEGYDPEAAHDDRVFPARDLPDDQVASYVNEWRGNTEGCYR